MRVLKGLLVWGLLVGLLSGCSQPLAKRQGTTTQTAPGDMDAAQKPLSAQPKPVVKFDPNVAPPTLTKTAGALLQPQWQKTAGSTKVVVQAADPVLERALGATVLIKTDKGLGSGFLIDDQGTVVTNVHVIRNAQAMGVATFDLQVHQVTGVVGLDEARDIAILKTDAVGYPTLSFGDTVNLKYGAKVFAVGNPFGLDWSVSDGIVASPKRTMNNQNWVQHTAPISPGNSGGPLVLAASGEVVGMNTQILVSKGAENLNFAVLPQDIQEVLAHGTPSTANGSVASPTQPSQGSSQQQAPPQGSTSLDSPQAGTTPPQMASGTPRDQPNAPNIGQPGAPPAAATSPGTTASKPMPEPAKPGQLTPAEQDYLNWAKAFVSKLRTCTGKLPSEQALDAKDRNRLDRAEQASLDTGFCYFPLMDDLVMTWVNPKPHSVRPPESLMHLHRNLLLALDAYSNAVYNLTSTFGALKKSDTSTADSTLKAFLVLGQTGDQHLMAAVQEMQGLGLDVQ